MHYVEQTLTIQKSGLLDLEQFYYKAIYTHKETFYTWMLDCFLGELECLYTIACSWEIGVMFKKNWFVIVTIGLNSWLKVLVDVNSTNNREWTTLKIGV